MQQPRHDLSTCRRSDKARRRPREGIGRDFLSEQGRRVALAELLGFAQVFLYALLPEEKLAPDRMIRSAASGGRHGHADSAPTWPLATAYHSRTCALTGAERARNAHPDTTTRTGSCALHS